MDDTEWRDVFIKKSVHDIREIVYDARQKAAAKKTELRSVVRHSHRDLLKTAITVIEMRDVLRDVESQYRQILELRPEVLQVQATNAEGYSKRLSRDGENVKIASAVSFVKTCLDITLHQPSLVLSAKALLAARLALNTLPKNSHSYFQTLRDRFTISRTRLLKQIDQALLHAQPLEALQSYAFITGSSTPEVLQHFLGTRLNSINSSLTISSPDSFTIIQVIHVIKLTITDVSQLFPFLFQRTTNELKLIPLLSQPDLRSQIIRKRGSAELWITKDLRTFLVWTKSEILDSSKVESTLSIWQDQIKILLKGNVSGLFKSVQDLDILCTLRGEIISSLIGDEAGLFETDICGVLVKEIAGQISRIMTSRVEKLHDLESMALEDVTASVWEVGTSKHFKVDQILSLKSPQDRPVMKEFATLYRKIMREIHDGEERLAQVQATSVNDRWEGKEISDILSTHQTTFAKEFELFSKKFETIINDILQTPGEDEDRKAAEAVCWLRLNSIIGNLPPNIIKFDIINNFAIEGKSSAQSHLANYIASKVGLMAKNLLSSRSWTNKLPEQSLWEGNPPEPKQPTRIPLQLIKEITTQLNSFGTNLLNCDFVVETKKCSAESISIEFNDLLRKTEEFSSDAARQLMADVMILELALSQHATEVFKEVKEKLFDKIEGDTTAFMERLTGQLETYWKRTSLLFGIIVFEAENPNGTM